MMGYWGWGTMGLGMAGMAIFWIGVVFLVVWAVARSFSSEDRPRTQETALDILKRRYASGEVTAEELPAGQERPGMTVA